MTTKHLPATLTIRAAGTEPDITITTPTRDLMRDTIDPIGMDTTSYLSGTRAVNFAHDHSRLPIGKTVTLTKSAQGIRAKFRWLDSNPEARTVRAVFEDGVLGASVEFVPVTSEPNRDGGTHYAKSILTGWALTANPANVECRRVLRALGLTDRGADVDLSVTAADVRAAVHAMRDEMRADIERRLRWAMLPDDAEVLRLDGEDEDVLGGLSHAEVESALRAAMRAVKGQISEGLGRELARARGRVD